MILAKNKIQKKLFKVINESLALLKQNSIKEQKPTVIDIPIPSLLDQCVALCEQHHAQTQEPIRTVHHFGLPLDSPLLSSLATLANTRVLKDIHPNNNSFKDSIKSQTVVPISINTYNDAGINTEDDEYRNKVFLNDLQQTQQQSNQIGQRLLICDNHCLSQTKEKHTIDLLTLLKRQFTVRSLIVVTDPVESYPVYCAEVKIDTPPLSFEEYCQSILDFIQANPDLTVIRHEDFVAEPERVMGEICEVLELPICGDFLVLSDVFDVNKPNTLAMTPENMIGELAYQQLCEEFAYDLNHTLIKLPIANKEITNTDYIFKGRTLEEIQSIANKDSLEQLSLERVILQWYFSDWDALTQIELKSLYQHPDKDRMALIIACAYQQTNQLDKAHEYSRLAIKWGCPRDVLMNLMVKNVQTIVDHAKAINQSLSNKLSN